MKTKVNIERVYDHPSEHDDGFRVFVDRLWPRGESKEVFHYDLWAKEVAPSTELRQWYHADPTGRWKEFARRYRSELEQNPEAAELAKAMSTRKEVTLLYGAKDPKHNNAIVLKKYLTDHFR